MLEKFFFDYANNNIRENLQALRGFISDITYRDEKVGEYIQSDWDEYLDIVTAILFMARDEKIQLGRNDVFGIEHLITIAKDIPYQNRRELVDAVMKRYKGLFGESGFKHNLSHFLGIYDIAFSSVYGHDYGICERELLEDRVKLFGPKLFTGPDRLKCYECDQLHFIHILKEIIGGKEYNEIPWFEYFLQTSNDLVIFRPYFELFKISSKDLKNNRQFHWSLRENKIFEIPLNFDQVYKPPLNNLEVAKPYQTSRFRECLISAAISSLAEFLLRDLRCHVFQRPSRRPGQEE